MNKQPLIWLDRLPSSLKHLVHEVTFLSIFFSGYLLVIFICNFKKPFWFFAAMFSVSLLIIWLRYLALQQTFSVKFSIFRMLVYVTLGQASYLVYAPMNSVFPTSALEAVHVIEVIEKDTCPVDEYQNAISSVWSKKQVAEPEYVVAGGFMYNWKKLVDLGLLPRYHPWYRDAMTMDGVIYLSDPSNCMSVRTYVHESVHVYQYHNIKLVDKIEQLKRRMSDIYYQTTDSYLLYDYGGIEGLHEARAAGKTMADFHPEQQAEIVADYYLYESMYSDSPPDEYLALLNYFTSQLD